MFERLPDFIDPIHFAEMQGVLKGEIKLNSLTRLTEKLTADSGVVFVDLLFKKNGKQSVIEGHIKVDLALECQNCLQSLNWTVDREIKLGIVTSIEYADKLPPEYEPLLIDEEKIAVKHIVEDELLLATPDFPKHQNECYSQRSDSEAEITEEQPKRENPFAVLAKLKDTGE